MRNPFDHEKALSLCRKLQGISSSAVGVLIAKGGKVVLKAFSGRLDGDFDRPGWCEPLFDSKRFLSVEREFESLMEVDPASAPKYSALCLQRLWSLYEVPTLFDGAKGLLECYDSNPPSGSGDCAGSKLLAKAIREGLSIDSLAEMDTATGAYIEPCQARCQPLFKAMLGLDIIYKDAEIAVINKDSGMLSIKGRTTEDCVPYRLQRIYGLKKANLNVHRLDQDTSGLMVLALTDESQARLQRAFESHLVEKRYVALVDGLVRDEKGTIELKSRLDPSNRPHQVLDEERGKLGITHYRRLGVERRQAGLATRLELIPITGRTHQLRLACAFGLGCPILGDRLYGDPSKAPRLMLHQAHLGFRHPATAEDMSFDLDPSF